MFERPPWSELTPEAMLASVVCTAAPGRDAEAMLASVVCMAAPGRDVEAMLASMVCTAAPGRDEAGVPCGCPGSMLLPKAMFESVVLMCLGVMLRPWSIRPRRCLWSVLCLKPCRCLWAVLLPAAMLVSMAGALAKGCVDVCGL